MSKLFAKMGMPQWAYQVHLYNIDYIEYLINAAGIHV